MSLKLNGQLYPAGESAPLFYIYQTCLLSNEELEPSIFWSIISDSTARMGVAMSITILHLVDRTGMFVVKHHCLRNS